MRLFNICGALIGIGFVFVSGTCVAQQFDAPYYAYAKKNKAKWQEDDKQINQKLASLKKKLPVRL